MENEKDIERIERELRERLGDRQKPKVPGGYFETFSGRLMDRIKTEPNQRFLVNSWLLPLTAAAAFALLVIFSQGTREQAGKDLSYTETEEPLLAPLAETEAEPAEEVLKTVAIQEEEILPRVELDMLEEELADSYEKETVDEFDLAMQELSQEEIEDYLTTTFNYSEL